MPNLQTFDDLTNGVNARVNQVLAAMQLAIPAGNWNQIGVLVQDAHDVTTEIETAILKIGMLIMINMPSFRNQNLLATQINAKISFIVEVGEKPITWRNNPLTLPTAKTVAQTIARGLQGFNVTGFEPLRVVDGEFINLSKDKRQVYSIHVETQQIFAPPPV